MDLSSFDHCWRKRARFLTQALMISGTLNLGFLAASFYFLFKESDPAVTLPLEPLAKPLEAHPTLQKIFTEYSQLLFPDLVALLGHRAHVEEGVSHRDIALACLVNYHHFYLDKALGGAPLQKRRIQIQHPESQDRLEVIIITGLSDDQYQAIIQFAKTERWPLTPEGLFYEVQSHPLGQDPSLLEAFFLTPECYFAHHLFTRSGLSLTKETLIQLLSEGSWDLLKEMADDVKLTGDFSIEKRRQWLLRFLDRRSFSAARLLVQYDYEFILKRLDDIQLKHLLTVLSINTPITLAKDLLASPRSDALLKMTAGLLYAAANESIPEVIDLSIAKEKFLPKPPKIITNVPAPKVIVPKKTSPASVHIVQRGENLWKIARKYQVSIEKIMEYNHLETDRLKVGKKLQIPPT